MRLLLTLLFIFISGISTAEASLVLAEAPIDRFDTASIKRGAEFFSHNCIACHTLIYLRYDKIANEAGITYEKMPLKVQNWPLGVKPPDLSLEADIRGVDWIYTYLHSFYVDPTRPTGANNLLVPNTAMANMLGPYQGEQKYLGSPSGSILLHEWQWYDMLEATRQGSMSPSQFDETVADLVNFLAYAAEPFYIRQHIIGFWVLAFLSILFVFVYFLKREYWKDVKKHREE